MTDFKKKCLGNRARKVLFKVRNSIIAVIMRYKWDISHAPHVRDSKDFLGFIPLRNRSNCVRLIVKPMSKAGNGSFGIVTLGFQTGCKGFVWLSSWKQDRASIEIYRHFLIWQTGFRYKAWSHLPTFSFCPVAGHSPLPCNVTPKWYLAFWLGAIPRIDDHRCIQTE